MDIEKKEINGFFKLNNNEIFGTVNLQEEDTLITFKSKTPIPDLSGFDTLTGIGFNHKAISCLQCIDAGFQHEFHNGGIEYTASAFPHYVSVGDATLNNTETTIIEVSFTTNDLSTLFNDRDAFGHLFATKSQLQDLLTTNHEMVKATSGLKHEFKPPKILDNPHIFYWTGNLDIYECQTEIGLLTIHHNPSFSVDGKSGISCTNNITANIKYGTPINFDKAIDNISTFARFFSIIAGRTQKASNIKVKKINSVSESYLDIYCSYGPSISPAPLQSAKDIPVSPIHRPEEFSIVLKNWINRENEWCVGRIQHLNGMNKNRSYDTDRLVSAANTFDILPSNATLPNKEISQEYKTARDECINILESLPTSDDRAAAIGVMKRWGRANLRSKVLHRASIIKANFSQIPSEIDRVLVLAIKTRNHFVHGSDDFKYEKYEDFLPLFTDALEFVFSASDLIECGWNPIAWQKTRPSSSHTYSYFINSLGTQIDQLKLVAGEAQHWPT
jgi:hypothetical protein